MNAVAPSPALVAEPSLDGELIGILAGWGRFPMATAEAIRRRGGRVAILTIRHHAEESLEPLADVYGEVGVAEIGKAIDFFRQHGVLRATMAGKIHKKKLFRRFGWLRHLPDWRGLKTFWPHVVSRRKDNRDDSLLGAIAAAFDRAGVRICPATDFAPELLATGGVLAGRPLSKQRMADVAFGWKLAKELGRLDIGQTVVEEGVGEALEGGAGEARRVIDAPGETVDLEALQLEACWFQGHCCELIDSRAEADLRRCFDRQDDLRGARVADLMTGGGVRIEADKLAAEALTGFAATDAFARGLALAAVIAVGLAGFAGAAILFGAARLSDIKRMLDRSSR